MVRRMTLILVLVALVATGCSQDNDDATEPVTIATTIIDEWNVAWVDNDIDAIVAPFTEDGVYQDPTRTREGKDSIRSFAETMAPGVTFSERLGEGIPTESGSFVFPMRFESHGDMVIGDIEIELSGDLASRIEWITWAVED